MLNTTLRDPDRPEDITPEQARLLGYLEQALKAKLLFARNKDYIVQNNEIIIVDEFTVVDARQRWSEGLHQAVKQKRVSRSILKISPRQPSRCRTISACTKS
jgi:preprotein translocase subunit SecA